MEKVKHNNLCEGRRGIRGSSKTAPAKQMHKQRDRKCIRNREIEKKKKKIENCDRAKNIEKCSSWGQSSEIWKKKKKKTVRIIHI